MRSEEIYNIHEKINSIIPFFKSKYLCKKGIHNYRVNPKIFVVPSVKQEDDGYMVQYKVTKYNTIDLTNLKCFCCGKETKLDR